MYFPVLHNKPVEIKACSNLHSNALSACPIVKIKVPKDDGKSADFKKRLDSWVEISAKQGSVSLAVDSATAGLIQSALGEISPKANLRLAIAAVNGSSLWDAVKDVDKQFNAGALLLLTAGDTTKPALLQWIAEKQKTMFVDVAIDFGSLSAADLYSQTDYASVVFSRLEAVGIQNAIFLGGSYPVDNSNLPSGKVTSIERREWQIYKRLLENHSVSYGDFGPLSPTLSTSKGSSKKVTPAIRYATEDHWMVHRGENKTWDQWGPQMVQLATDVVEAEYFSGSYFSWGDDQLEKTATEQIPPPGNWQPIRTIEINHHLSACASATARLADQPTSPLIPQATGRP